MLMPDRRDCETETVRITIFETLLPENPMDIRPDEILKAFDDAGVVLLRGFNFDLGNFEAFTRGFCDNFYTVSYRHMRGQFNGDSYSNEVF